MRRITTGKTLEISTIATAGFSAPIRLRQVILKQPFAGRLVPQDPADQSASELLESIRVSLPARGDRATASGAATVVLLQPYSRAVTTSSGQTGPVLAVARHVRVFETIGVNGESLLVRTEEARKDWFESILLMHPARTILGVFYK